MNTELNQRLQKYIDEFNDDIKLTVQNLRDKSMMISSVRAKWIRYYFMEKTLCEKLKAAKTEYSKKLAKNVSSTNMFPTVIPEADSGLTRLNTEIRNSEMCIEFIDKAFNVLDNFNFQIKNTIDIIKLENT
jgi:hypothetical protein